MILKVLKHTVLIENSFWHGIILLNILNDLLLETCICLSKKNGFFIVCLLYYCWVFIIWQIAMRAHNSHYCFPSIC